MKLISDFWPPEMELYTLTFFEATKSGVMCQSSNRRLMGLSTAHLATAATGALKNTPLHKMSRWLSTVLRGKKLTYMCSMALYD